MFATLSRISNIVTALLNMLTSICGKPEGGRGQARLRGRARNRRSPGQETNSLTVFALQSVRGAASGEAAGCKNNLRGPNRRQKPPQSVEIARRRDGENPAWAMRSGPQIASQSIENARSAPGIGAPGDGFARLACGAFSDKAPRRPAKRAPPGNVIATS